MNSTTTDWIRTSMKAAVPLKQADSICFDLGKEDKVNIILAMQRAHKSSQLLLGYSTQWLGQLKL